jgi:hypothetical protein
MELGVNETTCPNGDVPTNTIDDPHLLRFMAEFEVPLYVGSELNRLISTLMLLNVCATHRAQMGLWMNYFLCCRIHYCQNLTTCLNHIKVHSLSGYRKGMSN